MESPYNGRATIEDSFNGVTLSIPSRKNWFITIFLGFWLCTWFVVILVLPFTILTAASGAPIAFIFLWLCGWTVGGFFAFRIFLWNVMGKEIISFEDNVLTFDKKYLLFYKAKSYDLTEARNFRVQEDPLTGMMPFGMRPFGMFRMGNSGTIRFDYGMQTIKFADGVDEAEASFILEKLRNKKLIN